MGNANRICITLYIRGMTGYKSNGIAYGNVSYGIANGIDHVISKTVANDMANDIANGKAKYIANDKANGLV